MNVLDFSDLLCGKLRHQQQCRSARLTILQRHGHDVAMMLEGTTVIRMGTLTMKEWKKTDRRGVLSEDACL